MKLITFHFSQHNLLTTLWNLVHRLLIYFHNHNTHPNITLTFLLGIFVGPSQKYYDLGFYFAYSLFDATATAIRKHLVILTYKLSETSNLQWFWNFFWDKIHCDVLYRIHIFWRSWRPYDININVSIRFSYLTLWLLKKTSWCSAISVIVVIAAYLNANYTESECFKP